MSPLCFPPEQGNQTPVRDSPAIPRLRSVNSYTNIRAVNSARNLNKSLQNLNLNEEGEKALRWPLCLSISGETKTLAVIHQCAMVSPAMIKISETIVSCCVNSQQGSETGFHAKCDLACNSWGRQVCSESLLKWQTFEPQEFLPGRRYLVTPSCPLCWTSAVLCRNRALSMVQN